MDDYELSGLKARFDALLVAFEDDRQERRQWQRDLDQRLFGPSGVLLRHSSRLGALERARAWLGGIVTGLGLLTLAQAISLWWGKR